MPVKRTLKLLFFTIELNLLIWLATVGALWAPSGGAEFAKTFAIVGVAFAAIVQHWAYYAVKRQTQAA